MKNNKTIEQIVAEWDKANSKPVVVELPVKLANEILGKGKKKKVA